MVKQAPKVPEKVSNVRFTTYQGWLRVSFVFHVEFDANLK